jgi:diaminopropionate ammonia-lyase
LPLALNCFGAKAVIYLSVHVPEDFANRLRDYGAEVVIAGDSYEESMDAALARAKNRRLANYV